MGGPGASKPTFREALRLWLKIGCIGFGGPSGQIAILQSEVVEKRGWVGEEEFLRALQFCMFLPGPEAQQLATYLGWRLHGIRGGIAAGILFFLPAAFLLWGLSLLYVMGNDSPPLHAFFDGLKPAVVAIVVSALWRIGSRTVTSPALALIAGASFLLLCFHAFYPLVVIGAAVIGFFFLKLPGKPESLCEKPRQSDDASWSASLGVGFVILLLWFVPLALLVLWLGLHALPVQVGIFFGKVAVLSFGGAYAALSYVTLHASGDWRWITSGEMLDGLGLAETTPGPLLIALQFVAFLACYKVPGVLSPLLSATLGSLAALWSLFLPSFLWIFSLAPHMGRIAGNRRVAGSLSAIGAVVTAVIATLMLWFAHGVFLPHGSIALGSLGVAFMAFLLLQFKRAGIISLIVGCGLIGVVIRMVG